MDYSKLAEALGIAHTNIIEDDNNEYLLFDNYVPYGGGGKGSLNGHYGCRHSTEAKLIMSQKKKGKPTWNKGITGYLVHTEQSKNAMREKLIGSKNAKAILDEDKVRQIINLYLTKPDIIGVGKIQKNGLPLKYDWAFCKMISQQYGTTPAAIKRLIQKKSWIHVWSEYKV